MVSFTNEEQTKLYELGLSLDFNMRDLMIKHNSMVSTNNFLLRHLGMTWDEFQNLPKTPTVCEKHFEENCVKCKK